MTATRSKSFNDPVQTEDGLTKGSRSGGRPTPGNVAPLAFAAARGIGAAACPC